MVLMSVLFARKYGRSSVAAGVVPMSHVSSLFVVVGPVVATPKPPIEPPCVNVAFGSATRRRPCANSEPVRTRVIAIARIKAFFIRYLLHKFWFPYYKLR